MALVAAADLLDPRDRVVGVGERKQALAGGQESAEAGVLREHRPARCEVAGAAIAEPAAAREHVAALGDAELGQRAADERAGRSRGRRRPSLGSSSCQPLRSSASRSGVSPGWTSSAGRRTRVRVRRDGHQLPHGVGLLPVVRALVLDRAVSAPVPDGREAPAPAPALGRARPVLQHHRRHGRDPVEAAGGHGAAPAMPIAWPTVTKWVWPSKRMSMPDACQSWLKAGRGRGRPAPGRASTRSSSVRMPEMLISRSALAGGRSQPLVCEPGGLAACRRASSAQRPSSPKRCRHGAQVGGAGRVRVEVRWTVARRRAARRTVTSCPSRANPSRYWSTAQVAPALVAARRPIIPLTRIRSDSPRGAVISRSAPARGRGRGSSVCRQSL